MVLSSVVVTLGPLVRIEGTLPSHALRMAKDAGAFEHGGEVLCRRGDWERVQGALRAAGVAIRTDEGSGPGKAVLGLGNASTGRIEGVLPRRIPKTWFSRVQGRALVNITPYALEEARQALLEEKADVEVKPEYRRQALAMDDRCADVLNALSMPDDELPDVKLQSGALRHYQRRALAVADAMGGRMYLADEVGVGKTLPSIAYAVHKGVQRTLIICLRSLKGQWRDEIRERVLGTVHVLEGRRSQPIPKTVNWLIVNPDILSDRFDDIQAWAPEYVIRDEAHTDKKPETARAKALFALATKAAYYWPLTGTPVDNTPIDAWVQFNILQPNWWGTRYDFGLAHCKPEKNWWASQKAGRDIFDFKGVTEETKPILNERLPLIMLRRTKQQVGLEMPKQTRTLIRVELDSAARESYNAVLEEYRELVREAKKVSTSDRELEAELQRQRAKRAALGIRMRRVSSIGRIEATLDLAQTRLDAGKRVLVYAYYRETVEELLKAFKARKGIAVDSIYGGDQDRREGVIDRFKAGGLDVLVSSIIVGGAGLNFQKVCHTTITHEFSYKPIDIEQTEGRVYRSGQEMPVEHLYTVGEDTLDERVLNINLRKMAATDAFLRTDEAGTEDEYLREIERTFFDEKTRA